MKFSTLTDILAKSQATHPWRFLIVSSILTILAAYVASGLKFDSSYEALLPQGAPELKNVDYVRDRTGGTRQLVIAIGGDKSQRLMFGKKLQNKLQTIDEIRCADLEFPVDFFKKRGLWLTDVKTLEKLVSAVKNAVDLAKEYANPLALHLDEEAEEKELKAAWKKVDDIVDKKTEALPFDEIMESKDGKYTFLLVVPSIKFSDIQAVQTLLNKIKETVNQLNPQKSNIEIKYAGNLEILKEQHVVMSKDLRTASILALVLGILIVASFTRKPSAPFLIGTALVFGVVWTFAVARIIVGNINIVTGFLVAIIIGLGIDFGIHLYVRFKQESSRDGISPTQAIQNMTRGTAAPAMTSALTTACVFLSFIIADFRGFSEFGLIAGFGVILTFLSSFLVLPPLLQVVHNRKQALKSNKANKDKMLKSNKTKESIGKPLAVTLVLMLFAFAIFGAIQARKIEFKNNFKDLRGKSEATAFFEYVNDNLGAGFNPTVVLVDSLKDAQTATGVIKDFKQNTQVAGKPSTIGRIVSITDLLPKEITTHKLHINKLRNILMDPKLDKSLKDKNQTDRAKKLKDAREMINTEPWSPKELPDTFKSRFLSKTEDGFIIYLWPQSPNYADYEAAAWEAELAKVSKALDQKNIKHRIADETLIIAWVYKLVKQDGFPLLFIAIAMVLILLLIDFRSPKRALMVFLPLSVGMLIFAGAAYLLKMNLNMFNIVVVPSIIGIGIDNAVHIYHRYRQEGKGSIKFVIRKTGAAAFLASLTTSIGFGSSVVCHSVGLQTMGQLAVIGIGATFIAAVVFFPSVLSLLEGFSNSNPHKNTK